MENKANLAKAVIAVMKEVKGYEEMYAVTPDGIVYGLPRILKRKGKGNINKANYFEVNRRIDKKGYIEVRLSKKAIRKCYKLHRIMAEAFIPNPNNYSQINHKNGNKADNSIENLEWCTPSQNLKHAYDNNLRTLSKSAYKGKVVICTQSGRSFNSVKEASIYVNINEGYLKCMLNGKNNNKTSLKYL